ncbi:MAG: hypothetical protein L0241_30190 [Planctomycetia bacterium]|nr:hypothetical protein [Planctomycetia bacterium]
MLRSLLLAVAVALAGFLALERAPKAGAADELTGNWQLSTITLSGESVVCILKVEEKNGKPSASVLFSPPEVETSLLDFRVTDKTVSVTVKQVRRIEGSAVTTRIAFVGVRGSDKKLILGSTGDHRIRHRAKFSATNKQKLGANELFVHAKLPAPITKALELSEKVSTLQKMLAQEKDETKQKQLQDQLAEARTQREEKLPALYREVIDKHPDSPASFDAAMELLYMSTWLKMTVEEVEKLVKLVQKHSATYGPLFSSITLTQVAGVLASVPGLEGVAVAALEPSVKALSDDYPVAIQFEVLDTYKFALEKAGKLAEAKTISLRLDKLDGPLDAEYLKTVPPFSPTPFAGRKKKDANQVAVLELFTGTQCPQCVAADVAFEALLKSYKPTDLVLLQYHVHIPGPDPLTNPASVARWDYFAEKFPDQMQGTPSALFNGVPFEQYDKNPAHRRGGGLDISEDKFAQYVAIINPLLEKSVDVQLRGKATRTGDKIELTVEVTGGADTNMKLRVFVVEESVKYVGGNGVRFHHHVVRMMPNGVGGVAIKEKAFKHTARMDVGEVRKELTKYLDDFAADSIAPFPKPDRPLEMKALKVIALVQNDKTKEIVQAVQFDVKGKGGR